jgi:hypothetical protein
MPCPTHHDLENRPQAVRRADSIHCLDAAAEQRASAMRRHRYGDRASTYDAFIFIARQALENARRYDAASRRLGWRLP